MVVFKFSDEFLKRGRDDLLTCIQIYQECKKAGVWPGRHDSVQTLELPEWAQADLADEITVGGVAAYGND